MEPWNDRSARILGDTLGSTYTLRRQGRVYIATSVSGTSPPRRKRSARSAKAESWSRNSTGDIVYFPWPGQHVFFRSWLATPRLTKHGLRDHDQPAAVHVAFPCALNVPESDPLAVNPQQALCCMVHHLLKGIGPNLPRRDSSRPQDAQRCAPQQRCGKRDG